jgi:hypothetical protein
MVGSERSSRGPREVDRYDEKRMDRQLHFYAAQRIRSRSAPAGPAVVITCAV